MGANLAPEIFRLLRQAGCKFVRHGKGSHEIWFSPINQKKVVVPSTTKKRHTANEILSQAGLKKHF